MIDRVPLPSVPGALSGFVAVDLPVGTLPANSRLVGVTLTVADAPSGGTVAAAVRTATGGGGSGIAVTIADGSRIGTASGSILLASSTALYLRITAESGSAFSLSGWIEVEESVLAAVTGALTTLERVKRFLNKDDATDDALLNELIVGVGDAWEEMSGRRYNQTVREDEAITALVQDALVVDYGPIISIEELRDRGSALPADEYSFEGRLIYRVLGGLAARWGAGLRRYEVDYTSGYVAVPERVVLANTMQVAHLFHQTQRGGGRLGMGAKAVDGGGSTTYSPDSWLPFALQVLNGEKEIWP